MSAIEQVRSRVGRRGERNANRAGRRRRALLPAVALAVVSAACAADEAAPGAGEFIDEGAAVIVANSPGTITTNGPQRVLVALLGEGPNEFLGSAERPAMIEFLAPDGADPIEVNGSFLSTSGVPLGLYVASMQFDQVGRWEVRIAGNERDAASAFIDVAADSPVPGIGDPAPPSATLTAATAEELDAISTDPEPNPDFYVLSIEEAVANGKPTAIVFSTPAFCRTAICGPTVEMVKEVAPGHPEVDFVHVEPFDIEEAIGGSLVPIAAMAEWQLATEPWIFVVDADGRITASFEGIIGAEEFEAALNAL